MRAIACRNIHDKRPITSTRLNYTQPAFANRQRPEHSAHIHCDGVTQREIAQQCQDVTSNRRIYERKYARMRNPRHKKSNIRAIPAPIATAEKPQYGFVAVDRMNGFTGCRPVFIFIRYESLIFQSGGTKSSHDAAQKPIWQMRRDSAGPTIAAECLP